MLNMNKLMNLVNGLEEKQFVDENDRITENDINEFGIVTIRNDDILEYNGLAVACMALMQFETIENYVPLLVLGNDFYEMSENGRSFVVAHELGHAALHVTDEILLNPEYERNLEHEFQADEYAAKQMGVANAVAGLQELKHVLDITSEGLNIGGMEEVDIRIQNIMDKFMVTC